MEQVRLKITGYVQGVFFRAETQDEAQKLGLTGWAKNTSDGGVEIIAQGPIEKLQALIDWCRKGPGRAEVSNIDIGWQKLEQKLNNFSIL